MAGRSLSPELLSSSPISPHSDFEELSNNFDLSNLPPVFVLQARIPIDQLHELEETLTLHDVPLTYDANEAQLFLAGVHTKKRATFELRAAGIWTEEIEEDDKKLGMKRQHSNDEHEKKAKRRIDSFQTGEEKAEKGVAELKDQHGHDMNLEYLENLDPNNILVLKSNWIEESISQQILLNPHDYLIYHGKRIVKPSETSNPEVKPDEKVQSPLPDKGVSILQRAREDTPPSKASRGPVTRFVSAPHGSRRFRDQGKRGHWSDNTNKPALLPLETHSSQESGHDATETVVIPPPPDWVRRKLKYACQRITPMHPPNEDFAELLKKIRLARLLTSDEVGVRAYSSAIAAIAAVPSKIVHPREIVRLPGCDVKFANLWIEYKNTGTIKAAEEVDKDETLQILNTFYDIWGVGDKTAREFHFEKGWRDIDDVIEYGWDSLTRVQQIGVKYYDEFLVPIPRKEVEEIVDIVKKHAIKVRDEGIEILAVGGYRRGKESSGDVDMIVSHREFSKTANLVTDIVASLETEGWVTHTLRLDLRGTHRDQGTIPLKAIGNMVAGQGFDTLDKAMVVWQDISWPTKDDDMSKDPNVKNPNLHRRVDIIVSPWRTVGCAVLGWSGGTTFQRDIRRYCKYIKTWKFDSSGIRHRQSGELIRLEGPQGISGSMEDAERTVFEGMGLEYRHPWERCTG